MNGISNVTILHFIAITNKAMAIKLIVENANIKLTGFSLSSWPDPFMGQVNI